MKTQKLKKRILVVDDESAIAEMVMEFCGTYGFDTQVMESGVGILETVQSFRPDMIILDLLMPGLSGVDVLKILRSHEETRSIPVLIVSVAADTDMIEEALRFSQGFLSKPVHMNALKEKLDQIWCKV